MNTMLKTLGVVIVVVAGLVGCSDTHDSQNSDVTWDIVERLDAGAGQDVDVNTGGYKIHFELKNESGYEIYAYPFVENLGPCTNEQKNWLSIERAGEVVRSREDCTLCTCGEDPCLLCDVDCEGAPTASRAALSDGEMRHFSWDGRVWVSDDENSCISPELAAGETLKATICYGVDFMDGENDHEAGHIVDPICQTIDFTIDKAEQTVRVVVPAPERVAHAVTIRMVNDSGDELYAYPSKFSGSERQADYGSWFRIGDGSSYYALKPSCELCECSELEENPSAVCDEDCGDIVSIEPWIADQIWAVGDARVGHWDGTIATEDRVAGQVCNRQVIAPVDALAVWFCWSETLKRFDETTGILGELTCENVDFERTDDVVELRVQ